MQKKLTKIDAKIWHTKDGVRVDGVHDNIRGDVSGISGDVSGILGDVSGIRGNVSGIRGDINSCKITDEERKRGVDITELIGE